MYNHLMRFASVEAAKAALRKYVMDGNWRRDVVVPDQRVVIARAIYTEAGMIATPEIAAPGYYLTVTRPAIDAELKDMPPHACRLIGNGDTGQIVYTASDINAAVLANALVEPLPAGSRYDFGTLI